MRVTCFWASSSRSEFGRSRLMSRRDRARSIKQRTAARTSEREAEPAGAAPFLHGSAAAAVMRTTGRREHGECKER